MGSSLRNVSRDTIEAIVRQILRDAGGASSAEVANAVVGALGGQAPEPIVQPRKSELVVSISARHIHLTDADVETLFGKGKTLTKMKDLYQDGFFAAEETVMLIGPRKRMLPSVRILGPTRKESQVELSFTDAISLGIDAPVRESGKLDGSPGCVLVGPAGVVELKKGVIRAARHVHMGPEDAAYYGVKDKDMMKLRVESNDCSLVFENVLVRVGKGIKLEVHLDTDEGRGETMQVLTINEVPGAQIERALGLVQGSVVRTKHIGRDFFANLKSIVGGELVGYTELLNEARQIATRRMIDQAEKVGADAIVGVRYTSGEIAQGACEVYAYGTAVALKK